MGALKVKLCNDITKDKTIGKINNIIIILFVYNSIVSYFGVLGVFDMPICLFSKNGNEINYFL